MTPKSRVLCFILVTILSISLVSAQALIAGKVYDANFEKLIADATVQITCKDTTLTTKTLNDGTYAVRFENTACSLGDVARVYAEKGNLVGENEGEVSECGEDCDDDYFSIINLEAKDQSQTPSDGGNSGGGSGGGGSGGGSIESAKVFLCGNGVCDSGESEDTCAKDCKTEEETEEVEEEVEEITETREPAEEIEENKWVNNSITGAFIAAGNYLNIPILSAILAFLIVLLIGHKIIQRKNRKIEF